MATTTKFQVKFLSQYVAELFGNENNKDPLLLKNLTQKVKYQLKKLGNSIQEEYKDAVKELQDLFERYSEAIPPQEDASDELKQAQAKADRKRVKEEFKEQFIKESGEIEDMEVEITHYDFTERDFIDQSTGDVVAGTVYFNLIDKLIYEKQEEPTPAKKEKEEAVAVA